LSGPPGTGKTLTAAIIGNELNTQVYQIDSSLVVSKYIGETEKNLERVFKRLEGKNCILFFDEADAMFGKRTEILDSKDRYANQGVSYLLQRIEKFDGLVILATNHENNFDEAFKRRILSRIHIGRPDVPERIKLWNRALPKGYTYSSNKLVTTLSEHFDFTGANIAVVVKMSIEQAFSDSKTELSLDLMNPFLEIVGREVLGTNYKPITLKI
jgi:SpoVK/Ycf46/Vps4 family AAA+-type ATPase